jgi:hypothetical protein
MAIRTVAFDPSGGITVNHDEAGHGGAVAFADLVFARNPDGTVNPDFLVVPCPVAGCGALSVHPVGGGAAPAMVQKLFLRVVSRRAAALGIPLGQRTFAAIKARVKARVLATDSADRWRLEAMTSEDDDPGDGA